MKVFICYRREDSQHQTGRLYDRLEMEFGAENVFKDVDSVPVGSDFRLVLRSAIDRCDVVLAVIGDRWIDIADESGTRRIDDPNDFVRIEIEWALKRNIAVVPVLVGNKSMPTKDELPKSIRKFAYRHGVTLRPDPFFRGDVGLLVNQLKLVRARAKKREAQKGAQVAASESKSPQPSQSPQPDESPQSNESATTSERRGRSSVGNRAPSDPAIIVAELADTQNLSTVGANRFPQRFAAITQRMVGKNQQNQHPVVYGRQLVVCGILLLILGILGLIYGISLATDAPTVEAAGSSTSQNVSFPPAYFMKMLWMSQIGLSLLSIVGAISTLQKRRYVFAILAAYGIVIPCFSPLFGIGIPLGAWAMIILLHPEVRARFR